MRARVLIGLHAVVALNAVGGGTGSMLGIGADTPAFDPADLELPPELKKLLG